MANINTKKGVIGILTGGGDVPGLNPAIRGVTTRALHEGYQVIGFRHGWAGLVEMVREKDYDNSDNFLVLTQEVVDRAARTGGTFLHSSRTNPGRVTKSNVPAHLKDAFTAEKNDLTAEVLKNLAWLGIDTLIPIGGDDTLSYGVRLHKEGFKVIAIPKTMDNDVQGTEYCIGFSTAISRAKEAITRQRTTLGSHERIGIFRIFGRDSGFTALYTAYVTAGRCVIPEVQFELDHLIEILMEDKRNNPSRYAFVIVSEGAVWRGHEVAEYGEADAYGHRKKVDIGHALGEELHKRKGEETMVSDLTYELRSGDPDALDQIVAITFANVAVDLIREGVHGRLTAVRDGKYTHTPLPDPKLGARRIDVPKMYNVTRYRPHYAGRLGSPLLLSAVES
jgi:ATP-dependent phosphofructokinase / diphosphate-dependent phosphofructokinase